MRSLVLLLTVLTLSSGKQLKKHPCDYKDCRAGRECVVVEGEAQCLCVINCPDRLKPICGTDGNSYDNHCRLHQRACLSGEHIGIEHKGYCKSKAKQPDLSEKDKRDALLSKQKLEKELENDLIGSIRKESNSQKPNAKKTNPEACFSPQRNAVRFLLVQHWQETLKDQPWHLEGMTYRESLWGWFFSCDKDKDNFLTPEELHKCSKDVAFFARPGQDNVITKELCINALVDDGDRNGDWKLDFEEFTRVMDPKYEPKNQNCTLEGKIYKDGDETTFTCNRCVCAVGHWVCTAEECEESSDNGIHMEKEKYLKKQRKHSTDFDNSIDEHLLDSAHAGVDTWMEDTLKDKIKGKEKKRLFLVSREPFEVDDNLDEKTTKVENGGEVPQHVMEGDFYDGLYEKNKKKQDFQKVLKDGKMNQEFKKKQLDKWSKMYKKKNIKTKTDKGTDKTEKKTDRFWHYDEPLIETYKKPRKHYSLRRYEGDLYENNQWNDLIKTNDNDSKKYNRL